MFLLVCAAVGFLLGLANRPWWWALVSQIAGLSILLVVEGMPPHSRRSDLIDHIGLSFFIFSLTALMAWAIGNVMFLIMRRISRGWR